ncbi:hypothetical protein FrCorBMG51_06375 [Protofrankia coriariae]|uniref:Uncharacterized protein n=1 Tax=Protofrankia coriariae TaxID=1562887 RepID=A0ABR5F6K4_9ACTN|nr:hypothetical protein FrCorBMG51_06375 [Protofrankia coriariae]
MRKGPAREEAAREGPARAGPVAAGCCPVCALVCGASRECGRCGWLLRGDHVRGEITDDLEWEFGARLATARRRFDLPAVVRVADALGSGDPGLADRLVDLVRGGPPVPGELDAARRAVRTASPWPAAAPTAMATDTVAVGRLLSRIVAGEVRRGGPPSSN